MWVNIRASAVAIFAYGTFQLMPALGVAEDAVKAPSGSVIAVTTTLAGAGQDLKRTVVRNYKTYWDEVFDYPIEQDASGNLVPGFALEWGASPDHLSWTFVIREGVKFHNGDTLTAADVAWSWNRLMFDPDTKHNLAGYAPLVESIKFEGNNVLIKTKTPQSTLPLWFAKVDAGLGGSALSEKYFERVGEEEASRFPIGTGPYKFVSAEGEQSVELTAFEDPDRSDWQKSRTPGFKTLTILNVPEASTRLALLKTGGADLVPINLSAIDDVSSDPNLRVLTVPSTNYSGMWCIGFTLNPASACNDRRVREALSIAIDREMIAKAIYHGQAQPSVGWYGGPGSFGYPSDMPPTPFDPDRARQLLTEAGFGDANPLPVELVTYNDDVDFPMLPTLAEAIIGFYEAIGIQASLRTMEWATQKSALIDEQLTGQLQNPEVLPITLFLRGMDNRYYFPAEQLGGYTVAGRIGSSAWHNENLPEQQSRLDAVAAAFDLPTQEALFKDYYKWMAENYNHIPLLASASFFGVSKKIKDWQPIAGKPFIHNQWTLIPAEE